MKKLTLAAAVVFGLSASATFADDTVMKAVEQQAGKAFEACSALLANAESADAFEKCMEEHTMSKIDAEAKSEATKTITGQ